MVSLSAQMNIIIEKSKLLIQMCDALKEENNILRDELNSAKEIIGKNSDIILELEEKVKALAVAKSLENTNIDKTAVDKKILDTKQKIDDFVREIDRCINFLK